MQDELFHPTIRDVTPPGTPPWRPESIAYPAFFGGPLAAAVLGVLNGRRLALPPGRLAVIAAAGIAGFGVRLAISAAADAAVWTRLAGSVTGLLVWLLVVAWQRAPFRLVTLRGTEPAGLVGPGLAAAVLGGLCEAILILVLTR